MIDKKLVIGFILYGSSTTKYLTDFLSSLIKATENLSLETKIIAYNNGPEEYEDNKKIIADYPQIRLVGTGENIGFGRANNKMISIAQEFGADFYLTLNPDLLLEADSIKELVQAMIDDVNLSAVTPKVRRWDFANKQKTKFIDTVGVIAESGLQFKDLGQGAKDIGQYDQAKIIGPSGCVAMFRMSAIEKIKDAHGYFDNRFFMYKEDCDLAWRLKKNNLHSTVVPLSIMYHDRTAVARGLSVWARFKNQNLKSNSVRQWSYFGQWLIVFKHWSSLNFFDKIMVIYYQGLGLIYAIIFERELLYEVNRARKINSPLERGGAR